MLVERLVYLFTSVLLTWFVQHLALVVLARRRDNFILTRPPKLSSCLSHRHWPGTKICQDPRNKKLGKGLRGSPLSTVFALHPLRLTLREHASWYSYVLSHDNHSLFYPGARVNGC